MPIGIASLVCRQRREDGLEGLLDSLGVSGVLTAQDAARFERKLARARFRGLARMHITVLQQACLAFDRPLHRHQSRANVNRPRLAAATAGALRGRLVGWSS